MNYEVPNSHLFPGRDKREPVIPDAELMLAGGEYANKMTLQKVAYDAGLPVPKIMTDDEAARLLAEGKKLEAKNSDTYYLSGMDDIYRIFVRGYYPDPREMWWVDVLPTSSAPSMEDIFYLKREFTQPTAQTNTSDYLRRNFNFSDKSDARFFLQQGDPGKYYFSTLTFGPYMFIAGNGELGRGVNWETFYKGSLVANDHWHFRSQLTDKILQFATQATAVMNDALPRKRTPFEFKHDFLMDAGNEFSLTLIQSRVASHAFTEEDLQHQEEMITTYSESGMPVVSLEPYQIGALGIDRAPREPFLLALTNDQHQGSATVADYYNADLSSMAGLILPQNMRGGLLNHDGYRFIAYALYWGLPISLTA